MGRGGPAVSVRHEMLAESIDIIRLLWQGGMQSYLGRHLTLEDAQVFDLPETPPTIAVAISGPASARVAGEKGDGIFATEPTPDLPQMYRDAGGADGPLFAEAPLCWAPNEDDAVRTAHERFRFGMPGWKMMAELPNIVNFEAATSTVRPGDVAERAACGPDPERHVQVVSQFLDAGFDHIVLHQVGPDQNGFFRFWEHELAPRLRSLA